MSNRSASCLHSRKVTKMKLLYVGGPVRNASLNARHQNILRGESISYELWKMGFSVICPHKNTEFIDGYIPDSMIIAGDLEQVSRCDGLVITPMWENSAGTIGERKFALERDIAVFYWANLLDRLNLADWVKDKYDIKLHIQKQKQAYKEELETEPV